MTTQSLTTVSKSLQGIDKPIDYILVDGSGSMMDKWFEMLDAIDAYVDGLKTHRVSSHLMLTVFDDHDIDCVQRNCSLDQWVSNKEAPIGLHGGYTPLYDAINVMGRRLRELNPTRASILIVTDGDENRSVLSQAHAKTILDWCRAKGWQVTFIGCDFDNAGLAAQLGATPAAAIGVRKQKLTDATQSLAEKRARYGLYGENMHFSEDERQKFGGFLAAPGARP